MTEETRAKPEVCDHCGLPLGRWPLPATIDGEPERFCCFGCVLARQVTRARGESGAAASALVRLGLAIFFAMNAMMVTLPTYVPAVYGEEAMVDGPLFQVLRVLATAFTLPVLLLLGGPILASAGRGLRAGVPNTDALIVLGTAAAYALSLANVIAGRPEVYFDTVVMLLVLVTLGRYLEARARADAGEAVARSLTGLEPTALRLETPTSLDGSRISVELLDAGDLVRVTPGDLFPADGVVVAGSGGVDQSVLTGEHQPLLVGPGDPVAGGSSSVDGVFTVRLSARLADSTSARIERMLAEARGQRTAAMRLADRVSAVMMPLVIALAAGAGLWWGWRDGMETGLLVGLAVLCVACPCGLGIATPVAVWTALRAAAQRGIVARDPAALERLARASDVFFDKTGTLTERTPAVAEVFVEPGVGWSRDELLAAAAAVERGLLHPVARAIAAEDSRAKDAKAAVVSRGLGDPGLVWRQTLSADQRVIPGMGASVEIDGVRLFAGSLAFATAELGMAIAPRWRDGTEIAVWRAGALLGRIRLREAPRPEAADALAGLRALGLRSHLLTGDTQAAAVVPALIAEEHATLGLLPRDKMEHLARARSLGSVVMVGDGINDGPALAAADVGIAVGTATDLARITADLVFMTDDLRGLPWIIAHARRVNRVIRQNLVWVFGYNAAAVLAAAAGALTPIVATLAMIGSSAIVVASARRLKRPPALPPRGGPPLRAVGAGSEATASAATPAAPRRNSALTSFAAPSAWRSGRRAHLTIRRSHRLPG